MYKHINLESLFLHRNHQSTSGHGKIVVVPRCHIEIKLPSFNSKSVGQSNALLVEVVIFSTVNTFKTNMDKYLDDHND